MTFTNLDDTDSEVISKELLEFYIEGVKEDIKKQDTSKVYSCRNSSFTHCKQLFW